MTLEFLIGKKSEYTPNCSFIPNKHLIELFVFFLTTCFEKYYKNKQINKTKSWCSLHSQIMKSILEPSGQTQQGLFPITYCLGPPKVQQSQVVQCQLMYLEDVCICWTGCKMSHTSKCTKDIYQIRDQSNLYLTIMCLGKFTHLFTILPLGAQATKIAVHMVYARWMTCKNLTILHSTDIDQHFPKTFLAISTN